MSRAARVSLLGLITCLAATALLAQEAWDVAEPATAVADSGSGGFVSIVLNSGLLGILNWVGIAFWAAAAVPLGIWSIITGLTTRSHQTPLATKLLICGAVWVFVLGWVGAAQGSIAALSSLSTIAIRSLRDLD